MIRIYWKFLGRSIPEFWQECQEVPVKGDVVTVVRDTGEVITGIVSGRHWTVVSGPKTCVAVTVDPFKEETKTREGELGL